MQNKLHRNYISKCVDNLLYLKEINYLPLDIISLIINSIWRFRSEPVFIIYDPDIYFIDYYDMKPTFTYNDIVVKSKEIYLSLRCYDASTASNFLRFHWGDSAMSSSILRQINLDHLPFALVVPGVLWDHVAKSNIQKLHISKCLANSVQILNGYIKGSYLFSQRDNESFYDFAMMNEWLIAAFDNTDFLRVQNHPL